MLEVVEAVLATRFKVIMTSIADLRFVKKKNVTTVFEAKKLIFVTFANSQQECVKGLKWD